MAEGDERARGALVAGSLVEHYAIIRFIARGGMGEVYLARDTRLGRKVALKLINAERVTNAENLTSFLFEARATATFNHPHIVTLYGIGEHEGLPYLALEYLEGSTLRERMLGDPAGQRESWRIGQAIAEALEEAHRHHVFHLDLKPENIIVPRDGRLRVVDFGLARLRGLGALATSSPRGTPHYMAPEQWRGEPPTSATDIWALGVILHELATGNRPYPPLPAPDLAAEVRSPAPVRKLAGSSAVPLELATRIDRCLAKQPERRPAAGEIVRTLATLLAAGRAGRRDPVNPFRGLLPFNEQHAEHFYGRDAEVDELLERLRESPILPVVGVSGAGKSSFVKAGVVSRLRENGLWIVLTMRPGNDPFHNLAAALVAGEVISGKPGSASDRTRTVDPTAAAVDPVAPPPVDVDELARRLADEPERLGLALRERAARERSQVLLVVDQLEEVVTLQAAADVRAGFLRAICLAADDEKDPVRVIFTVRDDFLGRLAEVPEMRATLRHVTVLQCPGPQAMTEILIKPLAAFGYCFDDAALVNDMLAAVSGESAALPLLQFVMQILWEGRDVEGRVITRAAYAALGGVAGALATRADQVLTGLSHADVGTARQILLRLVTTQRTRRVVPRSQLLENLDPGAAEILERLTAARLVVPRSARGGDTDDPELELVHESLIATWARLARWLDEGREDLALLADVGQAAELWQRHGRRADEAWGGESLLHARRALTSGVAVPELLREFVRAGEERERRLRRRRRGFIAGALTVTGGLALASLAVTLAIARKNAQIEDKHREAESSRATAQLEAAARALAAGDPLAARANLRSALETEDAPLARALWSQLQADPLEWSRPASGLIAVAFTPDGLVVLGGGSTAGSVVLARAGSTEVVRVLATPDLGAISMIDVSADGGWLAVGSEHGGIGVFRIATGEFRLLDGAGDWVQVRLAPDGRLMAAAGSDGRVKLFDVASGRIVATVGTAHEVTNLEISPDGKWLASCAMGDIVIADVATGATVKTLSNPDSPTYQVAFGSNGMLAAVGLRGAVRLWDVASGQVLADLHGQHGDLLAVAFSADGTRLATGGNDPDVLVWNVATRSVERRIPGRGDASAPVIAVAFSPDGSRLATAAANGIRSWDLTLPPADPGANLAAPDPVTVAFGRDGARIATRYRDHTVRIWDARSARIERILPHVAGFDLVFSPDGHWLAGPATPWIVELWDAASGDERILGLAAPTGVASVVFGPKSDSLAAVDQGGNVHLLDLGSGVESRRLAGGNYGPTEFAADGKLATWGEDNVLRVWDPASGKQERELSLGDALRGAIAHDGRHVFVELRDGVRRLDLATQQSVVVGRNVGNVLDLCVSTDGRLVASVGDPRGVPIWDLDTGREVLLPMLRAPEECAFSGDGTQLATISDDLRLWDVASGRPLWRAPILRASGELLTHLGWIDLPSGAALQPPATAWRQALTERALTAAESKAGEVICLATDDHVVEMWALTTDQRLWSAPVPGVEQVVAFPGGCAVRAGNVARFIDRSGQASDLATDATDIVLDRGELLVAVASGVRFFSAEGRPSTFQPGATHASAAARVGPWLALGQGNGAVDLVPLPADVATAGPARRSVTTNHPDSAVVRILEGPNGSLIVGHANGFVGVWDLRNGVLLTHAQLHGPVVHLLARGDKLHAASDLGDHAVLDLSVARMDYCALLQQVWQRVPVIWDAGAARMTLPPSDHRCAPRRP